MQTFSNLFNQTIFILCHTDDTNYTSVMFQESQHSNVKRADCALLPPCAKTLQNKLKRAHFTSVIWGNADSGHPAHGLDPLKNGWREINECYAPEWHAGRCMPNLLIQKEEREMFNADEEQNECSLFSFLTMRTPMHGVMTVKLRCKYLCYGYFPSSVSNDYGLSY